MSDHTTALVPIEAWCYNSPELRANGTLVDVGLLAEALIYYDRVLVNVANQPQFAELLSWFVAQNKYGDFLALINSGVLKIYDCSFATAAILLPSGAYHITNIQDTIQAEPDTFEQRFLYHKTVQSCLKHARQRARLYKTLRDNVIEVKADEFGSSAENAVKDYARADRYALNIQALVDELYAFREPGRPPEVEASVDVSSDGNRKTIRTNIDFSTLNEDSR